MPTQVVILCPNAEALTDESSMLMIRRIQATVSPIRIGLCPRDAPPRPETTVACSLHIKKGLMNPGILGLISLCPCFDKLEDEIPSMAEDRNSSSCIIQE